MSAAGIVAADIEPVSDARGDADFRRDMVRVVARRNNFNEHILPMLEQAMADFGALTGRITTMSVARVSQGVSRELREKVESDLAAQAIARYRAKAADYARQFGYSGYVIREVNVSGTEPPGYAPMPMLRGKAMASMASDESLPVEVGKAQLAVNVSGSVQLTK